MFDHKEFSRAMKIALADYLSKGSRPIEADSFLEALSLFNPNELSTDDERKACWINLYNGLTNYQIISHNLKKSVWELPDFFTGRRHRIGAFMLSLDDIEHGILRRNGPRKKDKPRQFSDGNPREKLMLESFDSRIHFALNCGSVSCPPIAFYTTENIEQELALAEQSFVANEFLVDEKKQVIRCSEIFIWYRSDFGADYLNRSDLGGFAILPMPYSWTLH